MNTAGKYRRMEVSDRIQVRLKDAQQDVRGKKQEGVMPSQSQPKKISSKSYSLKPLKKSKGALRGSKPLNSAMSSSGNLLKQYLSSDAENFRPPPLGELSPSSQEERRPSLSTSILRAGATTPRKIQGRVKFLRPSTMASASGPPSPSQFDCTGSHFSLESNNNSLSAWGEQFFTRDGTSLIDDWCDSYRDENQSFKSVAVFAELRLKEALSFMGPTLKPTRAVAAICCDLLLKISSLFGRYSSLMELLSEQILHCVFSDYTKVMDEATTVNARVLYQCTPFFESGGMGLGPGGLGTQMPATMRAQMLRLKRNARASERLIRKTRFQMWKVWAKRQKQAIIRCSGNPISKCFTAWKGWVAYRHLSWQSFRRRHYFRAWKHWKVEKERRWRRYVLRKHFAGWADMFMERKGWAEQLTHKLNSFNGSLELWGEGPEAEEADQLGNAELDPRQMRTIILLLRGAAHAKRHKLGAAHHLLNDLRKELGIKDVNDAECQTEGVDIITTKPERIEHRISSLTERDQFSDEGEDPEFKEESVDDDAGTHVTLQMSDDSEQPYEKRKYGRKLIRRNSLRVRLGKKHKKVPPLKAEQSEVFIANVYHEALKSNLVVGSKRITLLDILWMTLVQRFGIKSLAVKYYLGIYNSAKLSASKPRLSMFFSLIGASLEDPTVFECVNPEKQVFFLELIKTIVQGAKQGAVLDVFTRVPSSVPRDEVVKCAQSNFVALSQEQPGALVELIRELSKLPCYGTKNRKDQISIDEALVVMMQFYEAEFTAQKGQVTTQDAAKTIQTYARRYLLSEYNKKHQINVLQKKFIEVDDELHGEDAMGVLKYDEFAYLLQSMGHSMHPIMMAKLFIDWTDLKEQIALDKRSSATKCKRNMDGIPEEEQGNNSNFESTNNDDEESINATESTFTRKCSFLFDGFNEQAEETQESSALALERSFGKEAAQIAFARCLYRSGFYYLEQSG